MKITAIIPARYDSSRFPGKPLAEIKGKTLIEWVWHKVWQSQRIERVIVATDDQRIAEAVKNFGGEVRMTAPTHPSGTDRVAEAARGLQADWILNIQGDEPLIEASVIDDFINEFARDEIFTMARKLETAEDVQNPNVVKVVMDARKHALYFSRSPIPFKRDSDEEVVYWQHLGVYAYRPAVLEQFVTLPSNKLERAESLEQLRALENGIAIRVVPTTLNTIGVDTPEDIQRVEPFLK